jgi:ribosomal protein S18 acetylase RimI-like enzyme
VTSAQAIEIRRATTKDARAIAEIHVASWQASYADIMPASVLTGLSIEKRTVAWRDAIEADRLNVALAFLESELVGWTGYGKCRDADKNETWGEIESIYLHPLRYGQGIGTLLIEHACRSLDDMGYAHSSLWVLTSNWRARAFYERAGFVPDDQVREFEIGGSVLREMRYQRPLAKSAARS